MTASMRAAGAIPARSATCVALIDRVAEAIELRVEEIAEILIDRVRSEMDLSLTDLELYADLIAAAQGSVRLVTVMARSWTDPRIVGPPREAVIWARSLVARQLPPEAIIRVYRIGQARYQEVWFDELSAAAADPAVALEAVAAISSFLFTWVDTVVEPLLDSYRDEAERRISGASAIRAETLALILSGEPVDAITAGARLRYPLDRHHVALIAWPAADAPEETRDAIELRTAEAITSLAGRDGAVLIHREAPGTVFAWYGADEVAAPSRKLITALRSEGLHLAIGSPGHGLAGFRQSHFGARRARRVARVLGQSAPVTRFSADVEILDLLTQDVDAARRFAVHTLGALAEDDDRSRRLLATLEIFFQEGQNFARTARRLNIHENTIADRVRRALQLTGQDSADLHALRTAVDLAPLLRSGAAGVSGGAGATVEVG